MNTSAIALALCIAASAASADDMMLSKKAKKIDPTMHFVRGDLKLIKDGKVVYRRGGADFSNLPRRGGNGTASAFNLGALGGQSDEGSLSLSMLDSVKFDGKDDWLTVVMRNGDVIRGTAESLTPTTLRLKGREKAIRMSAVEEIVATEAPPEPASD